MANMKTFFDYLKSECPDLLGSTLHQEQVEGTEALLEVMAGWPIESASHVLSEVQHETGGGMWPVKETVFPHSSDRNPSDAKVISRLDRAWSKGQLPWVKTPYWRDGMFGRGQIQCTHEYNYAKGSKLTGVDLVADPSKALELRNSAIIAAKGCNIGMFTGKKLSDYLVNGGFDHFNARSIVNGDKNAKGHDGIKIGSKIRENALAFERALKAAGWVGPQDFEPIDLPLKVDQDIELEPASKAGPLLVAVAGLSALAAIASDWLCSVPFISNLCGG